MNQRQGTAANLTEVTIPTTDTTPTTSTLHCVTTNNAVLLQTARAIVFKIGTEALIMVVNDCTLPENWQKP